MPLAPPLKAAAAWPPRQIAVETPAAVEGTRSIRASSGGDFMVDVLKTLDFDYLAMKLRVELPRHSRGAGQLRQKTKPEILTCPPHEEIAVHMAQGYAKDGRQGRWAMMCHGTVGLQHALDGDV